MSYIVKHKGKLTFVDGPVVYVAVALGVLIVCLTVFALKQADHATRLALVSLCATLVVVVVIRLLRNRHGKGIHRRIADSGSRSSSGERGSAP